MKQTWSETFFSLNSCVDRSSCDNGKLVFSVTTWSAEIKTEIILLFF